MLVTSSAATKKNSSLALLERICVDSNIAVYTQVVDPKRASYGVENATAAVIQLAQTTMRSELGKITLDKTFEERTALNLNIVKSIQ